MAKSEMEKDRDASDFLRALDGQASTGVFGALGQQARQGQQSINSAPGASRKSQRVQSGPVSQRETDAASRLISSGGSRAASSNWFTTTVEILTLVGAFIGLCAGAWLGMAGRFEEYADMVWWQRTGLGALAGAMAAVLVVQALAWAISFTARVLLPVALRLAALAIVLGLIYLGVSGKI